MVTKTRMVRVPFLILASNDMVHPAFLVEDLSPRTGTLLMARFPLFGRPYTNCRIPRMLARKNDHHQRIFLSILEEWFRRPWLQGQGYHRHPADGRDCLRVPEPDQHPEQRSREGLRMSPDDQHW